MAASSDPTCHMCSCAKSSSDHQLLKFQESYGAIAQCEGPVNIFTLYSNITKTLELYKSYKGLNPDFSCNALTLLKMQIIHPEISVYDASEHTPCFPGRCNTVFHSVVGDEMTALFARQEEIYNEFMKEPLDKAHPLEALRHRCSRVLTMQKIRTLLCLWSELHKQQETLIKIESKPIHSLCGRLVIPSFPAGDYVKFTSFTQNKFHTFAEQEIQYQGKKLKVVITGHFETDQLSGKQIIEKKMPICTTFKVSTKETNEVLGSLDIFKCWKKLVPGKNGSSQPLELVNEHSHTSDDAIEPHCLAIDSIQLANNRREAGNGDYPILRMLIKTAVQVFVADRFCLLKVRASDIHALVFYAAGFRGSSNDNTLVREIRSARQQNQMFPQRSNTELSTLWLKKSERLEAPLEHFFPLEEKDPPSWNQILADDPPLGKIEGPILPTYNLRNVLT